MTSSTGAAASAHARLVASQRRARRAVADRVLDLPFATYVITDDLPRAFDCNVALVERPAPATVLLRSLERVAATAGWRHRRVEIAEPAIAEPLRAPLVSAGYTEHRQVSMVLAADPPTRSRLPSTDVVPAAAHPDLTRALLTEQLRAADAVVDQFVERERRLARVVDAHAVVAPPEQPVSRCLLQRYPTVTELDAVATLERHRGRGWSSAVLWRAVAVARADHAPDIMLVAAADGWQIDWYTRIGFRPAGTTSVFTRGAGAPTAA